MPPPALHHVAFACKDLEATHHFYAEVLGFPLVHAEIAEQGDGYLKHVFYDLGDGSCIAFFHLNRVGEPEEYDTAISTGLGLPIWVNHVAIRADHARVDDVNARLKQHGLERLMRLDHGWSKSTYLVDPNGIMVEFCVDDPGFEPDPAEALRVLRQPVAAEAGGTA